jgi:hypothetical protein
MGRHRKVDRPRDIELHIPESIYIKIREQLYSEIEGKVPYGAISNLGTQLFIEWLEGRGVSI